MPNQGDMPILPGSRVPERTPERVPVDTGNDSGGETNNGRVPGGPFPGKPSNR